MEGEDRLTLPSAVSALAMYADPHHQNHPAAALLLSETGLTWRGNLTTEVADRHIWPSKIK